MPPCKNLERAARWFSRTVTSAASRSLYVSTFDPPCASAGTRRRWRRVAIHILIIAPMLQACTARNTPTSDHFDGSRFHNRATGSDYSLWQEVKIAWELRTKKKNWPARFETPPYRAPAEPVLHGIRVLWIGHSTTLIQTPHLNIITDPILLDSIGPSVFGINAVTNPGVRIESLPTIDLILISHDHYDHLDLRSLHALVDRQRGAPPTILVGRGVGLLLKSAGFTRF